VAEQGTRRGDLRQLRPEVVVGSRNEAGFRPQALRGTHRRGVRPIGARRERHIPPLIYQRLTLGIVVSLTTDIPLAPEVGAVLGGLIGWLSGRDRA
jgi:hypothetical protein